MVRTTINVITGPFSKEKIRQMIREGELGPQDEVCRANHYWIFLHEVEEVKAQLGIDPPISASFGDDDEVTDTQTRTENDLQDIRRDSNTVSKKTLELNAADQDLDIPPLASIEPPEASQTPESPDSNDPDAPTSVLTLSSMRKKGSTEAPGNSGTKTPAGSAPAMTVAASVPTSQDKIQEKSLEKPQERSQDKFQDKPQEKSADTPAVIARVERVDEIPKVLVLGNIEKRSWWKLLAFALFAFSIFAAWAILELLRARH